MRTVFVFGAIAILASILSGCAVVNAGSAVAGAGARVVGTAAQIAGDVITAPFGSDESDKSKKD